MLNKFISLLTKSIFHDTLFIRNVGFAMEW